MDCRSGAKKLDEENISLRHFIALKDINISGSLCHLILKISVN